MYSCINYDNFIRMFSIQPVCMVYNILQYRLHQIATRSKYLVVVFSAFET